MKKAKGVYAYLESCGVLEKGSDVEIKEARKKYWREYKCKWRRNKRKEEKEISTSYSKEELEELDSASKKHGMNRTSFIKQATFAYINHGYVIPYKYEIRYVRQLLAMNYNLFESMLEQNIIPSQMAQNILDKLSELEKEVLMQLHNPRNLHAYIKDVIFQYPEQKAVLLKLIENT